MIEQRHFDEASTRLQLLDLTDPHSEPLRELATQAGIQHRQAFIDGLEYAVAWTLAGRPTNSECNMEIATAPYGSEDEKMAFMVGFQSAKMSIDNGKAGIEPSRNQLAADTVNGVYVCEHSAAADVLYDMDFYEALNSDFEGTIYGIVSNETAELIRREYGIR